MTVDTLGRAIQLYRRTATTRSALVLLAANAIPIVGVLFFGWGLHTILVLYWLENGIVGFWNILKINLARGSFIPQLPDMPASAALAATRNPVRAAALRAAWEQARQQRAAATALTSITPSGRLAAVGRAGLSIFFAFHYGMFWFVHGIFVLFALPAFGVIRSDTGETSFGELNWESVLVGGVALFLSHGASFLFNYIGRGEYLTATPSGQMGAVYGRVVVLHLTIILGAFAIGLVGSPIGALLILVILKTGFDLALHLRERSKADARIPADSTFGQVVPGTPPPAPSGPPEPPPPAPAAAEQAGRATQDDRFQPEQP